MARVSPRYSRNNRLSMSSELELVARALAGKDMPGDASAEALGEILRRDLDGSLALRHRAGPSLAMRASQLGLGQGQPRDDPSTAREQDPRSAFASWRQQLLRSSAQHMALEDLLERSAEALAGAEVPWIPLKGMDLATRVYGQREERVTSDLDLLVDASDLVRARDALLVAGFVPLFPGELQERYLREEGYAWQARGPKGGLLELHFRLWGSVDASIAEELIRAAVEAPPTPEAQLSAGGRRLPLAHAYVVAAVHAWLDGPPRGAHRWRDLFEIGRRGPADLAREIVRIATLFDLQAPVGLAAGISARLWGERTCGRVEQDLTAGFRAPERWLLRGGGFRTEPESLPLSRLVIARGLAGRRSRHSLGHLVLRRFWAHPGIVAIGSPDDWPWSLRRPWYQCKVMGLDRIADILARWGRAVAGSGNAPVDAPENAPVDVPENAPVDAPKDAPELPKKLTAKREPLDR